MDSVMACWCMLQPVCFLGVSGGLGKATNSVVKEGVLGCSCRMGEGEAPLWICCSYSRMRMYSVRMTLRSVSGFIRFPIKLSSISFP
jgi:hypothetical protein